MEDKINKILNNKNFLKQTGFEIGLSNGFVEICIIIHNLR